MRSIRKADVWARLVVHIMGACEQSWCVMGAGVQDSVVHQVLVEEQQACLSSPVALRPNAEEQSTDVSAASWWPDIARGVWWQGLGTYVGSTGRGNAVNPMLESDAMPAGVVPEHLAALHAAG